MTEYMKQLLAIARIKKIIDKRKKRAAQKPADFDWPELRKM